MTEPIHDYDPAQALEGREAIAVFLGFGEQWNQKPT